MRKPKLLIIVLFQNLGERQPYFANSPAPPLPGLLLAGLTPDVVDVDVLHEMVRPIDYDTDADVIALSFMDYLFPHARRVARRFRRRGKTVIAGGRYASTFPQELLPHFDAVVVGEAPCIWPQVVEDLVSGRLKRVYQAPLSPPLDNVPPPRYDLAEPVFMTPIVTEASRGCPFRCTYCALNIRPTAYRCRPIEHVIRDLTAVDRLPFHKRKTAMIYDNNFGGDMGYAKELLREIAKLDYWAIGFQFTFNCLQDDEFVDLLHQARGAMAFIGLESLNQPSLYAVQKRQNKVTEYREMFAKRRERGIVTFTGMMLALEEDTPEYYQTLPERIEEVDPSAVLLSISIPIPGTPFAREVEAEGRIFDDDLSHYEGDHLDLPQGVAVRAGSRQAEGLCGVAQEPGGGRGAVGRVDARRRAEDRGGGLASCRVFVVSRHTLVGSEGALVRCGHGALIAHAPSRPSVESTPHHSPRRDLPARRPPTAS